ncbi:hypothetical protein [Streptomyces sp. NPDC002221]
MEIGSYAGYIKDQREKAKAARAPQDALYERYGPGGIGTGE